MPPLPEHHTSITPPTDLEADVGSYLELCGFSRHKCCHPGGDGINHNVGGVCVTPQPGGDVTVGWAVHPHHQHQRGVDGKISVVLRVARTLAELLREGGYAVRLGESGRAVRVLADPAASGGTVVRLREGTA